MRPGNLSRFSKQLCLACLVLGGPRLAQGQRPVALPAAQHAPTCDAALREYKSVAQIGAPFDTLTMKLDPVKVTIDEFRSFMRARMAEIGATGYLTSETVIDADHSFTRFVPVFVPSDSARIRKDCTVRDAGAERRPPIDRGRAQLAAPSLSALLLAVEVQSPSNPAYDDQVKRELYLNNGVPEYWIVNTDSRNVA